MITSNAEEKTNPVNLNADLLLAMHDGVTSVPPPRTQKPQETIDGYEERNEIFKQPIKYT